MKIPYGIHSIDPIDIKNVSRALKNNLITQGPLIKKFEKKICQIVNAKYSIAVSSCTAGLHLALKAISEGNLKNNVYTSPISFISTANTIKLNNLNARFIDIDKNTLNICTKELKKIIQKDKKILAVIPVHLGGLASHSKEIFNICKKKKILVVEDAAHSFGGSYFDGSKIGSCKYSDITVFSFHPVKTITTGEGGIITTNQKRIYEKILKLRNHGIEKNPKKWINKKIAYSNGKPNLWYYEVNELGLNYRITDFQCALGLSQLKKLNFILNYRKKIADLYDKSFINFPNISIPQFKKRKESSNHLYILNINFQKLKINKNRFMRELLKKNIVTQVHYIPIFFQKFYKKNISFKKFKNSINYYSQALSIPIFYKLKLSDQKKIISNIKSLIKKNIF